jgi:hypothetical protein
MSPLITIYAKELGRGKTAGFRTSLMGALSALRTDGGFRPTVSGVMP